MAFADPVGSKTRASPTNERASLTVAILPMSQILRVQADLGQAREQRLARQGAKAELSFIVGRIVTIAVSHSADVPLPSGACLAQRAQKTVARNVLPARPLPAIRDSPAQHEPGRAFASANPRRIQEGDTAKVSGPSINGWPRRLASALRRRRSQIAQTRPARPGTAAWHPAARRSTSAPRAARRGTRVMGFPSVRSRPACSARSRSRGTADRRSTASSRPRPRRPGLPTPRPPGPGDSGDRVETSAGCNTLD